MEGVIGTLSLNPAIDKVVSLQDLRWGKHIRVKKIREVAAGKGINVARVIKRLGGDVIVIGTVGGPNGEWIKSELKKEGIVFDFVTIKSNVRESLTIMDEYRGREIHLREEGQSLSRNELDVLMARLRKLASRLSFFVISGRLPRGVPLNFYGNIIRFFKKKGIPVLLDTNGPGLISALRAKPDYIKPNLSELEEMANRRLRGKRKRIDFVRELLTYGINTVVVTDGPGKVLAMAPGYIMMLTPPCLKVKNTVGSGDAVTGALAYGMVEGMKFCDMLRMAVACGSANALSIGAGFLNRRDVKNLAEKVHVEVLYNHCN